MKTCSKCKKNKPLTEFSFKNKVKGLLHRQCKDCTRLLIRGHYEKNREYYLSKARRRNSKIKTEVIEFLKSYLQENPCVDCGESDLAVLEFDHKGETPKFMAISSVIRYGYPLEKIKEEIDKCVVRCANCHRRKTSIDFNWFKVKTHP